MDGWMDGRVICDSSLSLRSTHEITVVCYKKNRQHYPWHTHSHDQDTSYAQIAGDYPDGAIYMYMSS